MELVDHSFEFFMPAGLTKGHKVKTESNPLTDWRVGGVASTEDRDLEGERIMQKGIDLSYMNSGWGVFNWNHEKGPQNLLGPIDYIENLRKGLWTEGYLWKHKPTAQEVFGILSSVPEGEKSPLGFSVQGKVRARSDNGNIAKCLIREVAITHCPVNQATYTDLLKTFEDDYVCETPNAEHCSCPACVAKALEVTHANPPMSGGDVLRAESLECDIKDKKKKKRRKRRSIVELTDGMVAKSITKSQVVELVQSRRPEYTRAAAERFVEWLFAYTREGVF